MTTWIYKSFHPAFHTSITPFATIAEWLNEVKAQTFSYMREGDTVIVFALVAVEDALAKETAT